MSESGFDSDTTNTIPRDGTTRAHRGGTTRRRVRGTGPHRRSGTTRHYARKLSDETHSRIGGYRLIDKLGKGGMSVVYRALQIATGRTVALKVVNLEDVKADGLAEQIFREASALAQISHPHVITCYGFGEDRGRMYMALELLTGGDSTDLVKKQGRLDEGQIVDIALQAVDGFKAIHDAGFVHRDIKPSNIFMTADGQVKIADLGLAWDGSQLDRESQVASMGTPSYMSPEQVTGEHELDFRSDIYSLGASLFFYATGRPPYAGSDVFAVLESVVNEPVPDVREFNPSVSDDFAGILATMMHKRRERRYLSLDALKEDLMAVADGRDAVHCDHVSKPTRAITMPEPKGASTRLVPLLVGALVLVCIGLAATVGMMLGGEDQGGGAADGQSADQQQTVAVREFDLLAEEAMDWRREGAVDILPGGRMAHCAGGRLVSRHTEEPLRAIMATDHFTLEVVLRPSSLQQGGPARIFSWSFGVGLRNLTIGQQASALELRVRTTDTSANGLRPHLVTPSGVLDGQRQHVVAVRDEHMHRIYVDGREVAASPVPGDLSVWDDVFPMLIGDEQDGGYAWQGQIHRLRLLNIALDAGTVAERYRSWRTGTVD